MAESKVINDTSITSGLIVCKLTGAELQKRKAKLQKDVFSRVSKYEETESGFMFHFVDTDDALIMVADYMVTEHECCPFFDFTLEVGAHGKGIKWTISGPPEAKDLVRSLVETDN